MQRAPPNTYLRVVVGWGAVPADTTHAMQQWDRRHELPMRRGVSSAALHWEGREGGGGGVGGGPSGQLHSDAMQQRTTMSGRGRWGGWAGQIGEFAFEIAYRVRDVAQSSKLLENLFTHRIVSCSSESLAAHASPRVGTLSPCRSSNRRRAPADEAAARA